MVDGFCLSILLVVGTLLRGGNGEGVKFWTHTNRAITIPLELYSD